ncbi:hypothetical protein GGI03_001635 [Coemansia sp. RSA 2337]|nr:hypothetical protein H4S03_005549 [Coemansia sp. S3946]KAJ2113293.1 hypothetical protein IW146_003976 [Coemansia sp. RSA 922]KAJ2467309.1 hypothetical protein GGI03_001635 [Coemansia sp. RSA 2337]
MLRAAGTTERGVGPIPVNTRINILHKDMASVSFAGDTKASERGSIHKTEPLCDENVKLTSSEERDNVRPADGLFGWIPTLAAMVNYMFIFGVSNSYGVFSTYYLNVKFAGTSATTLAWIGTLVTSLMLGCSILTGAMSDKLGYRVTAYTGTVICTLAYILASFCKEVWQLILTQGVLLGIGASFLYSPSVSIPAQWFIKNRGLATGIAVAGSSIGGLWFTAAIQAMIDSLGAEWALRILGILTFSVTSLTNSLYYRRVPAKPRKSLFEFCAAKRLIFWLVSVETCTIYTGYWALTFYVGTNAKHLGGTLRDGSNLLLVLNAGSVVGRVMAGVIADRFGCINTLLISIMLTVVIEMPLWMTAKTITPLYVLCALYGLISPSFISINPVIIGRHFDMDVLASIMGMTNLFGGLGVLAGNLAQGAIFDKYDKREQFTNTIIFSGMFILFAGIVTFVMRVHVQRQRTDRRFFQRI